MGKKNIKPKKRIPIIIPSFKENTVITGFSEENGVFVFNGPLGIIEPLGVTISEGYMRENGKIKIVSNTSTNNEKINVNTIFNLDKFDLLFAIDTNTRGYMQGTLSIACSAFIKLKLTNQYEVNGEQKQDWKINLSLLDALAFINPVINPELIGWQELINRILKDPIYRSSSKVGIIVDSALNDIPLYNSYKKPILGEHYLPHNFELIYASADVGKDLPQNNSIRICDKVSRLIWDYVNEHPNTLSKLENINNQFIDGSTIINLNLVNRLSGLNIKRKDNLFS